MDIKKEKETFENFLNEKGSFYFSESCILNEAILYSLLAPGKRIRPLLSLGVSLGMGGSQEFALCCGMSVEMIHAYSLIHDDLPAMDNDDYRRGRLTNHKVYGEATAILAGDSLLNFAPEFLMMELNKLGVEASKILEITTLLLKASGHQGMVKGQDLDMENEKKDLSEKDTIELGKILENIHRLKTGAIITWSCLSGLYSVSSQEVIKSNFLKVEKLGQEIGLLFQMVDDILDETASFQEIGKTPGKDQASGKLTYTGLYGLESATEMARTLVNSIHATTHDLQGKGDWSIIKAIVTSLEEKLP